MSTLQEDLEAHALDVAPLDAAPLEVTPPLPEVEQGDDERHLRAVPPRRRRQPRFGLWVGSVVTVTSLFLLVAFNVFMVQGQFDLDRIAEQRTFEQQQYVKLRDQVARLSAPESMVPRALALGLVPSTGAQFVQAPAAGAMKSKPDRTETTQRETSEAARTALDASP
jgi:hypothetical protein